METRFLTKNTEYVVVDGAVAHVIARETGHPSPEHPAMGRTVLHGVEFFPNGGVMPVFDLHAGVGLVLSLKEGEERHIVTSRLVQDPQVAS